MKTIKIPLSQAEELVEWIALRHGQHISQFQAALDNGSSLELPSGAKLVKNCIGRTVAYYISGYAEDGRDVTIYEPLLDYDCDVMDWMYGLANGRRYHFFGGSEGLY
jgi:hypothetical protein